MKILFKQNSKVETVNNISVDDKCFPLIGGVHPYSTSPQSQKTQKHESPLIRESALWFKTLALDAIFVDCDRCLIFWTSIQNDVGQEVLLRRQISQIVSTYNNDFIPSDARPLFEDFTLFDFDASLKEMMGKCKEIAEKLSRKSYSAAHTNSRIANLLHVYILPSVTFSTDDLYALSRTRCLIEERVIRADSEISTKASAKRLLEVSLDNLKDNLIQSYNFESESYIRSCDPIFLKLFLKKVEEDSTVLNLNLEAEQSKVNWAKDHPNEYCLEDVRDLQNKRNEVHAEVEKLIKVREGLRNVLTRKEKVKKRKGKRSRPQQIEGCFQSIFVEINRRWEVDMKVMDQLIIDKVNISGAREATLSAILELQSDNMVRNSERSTKFMPVDFSDCHYDGNGQKEKSSNWLTLQERVSNILQDINSDSHKVYMEGCTLILSQIDLALSEYRLVHSDEKPVVIPVNSNSSNVVHKDGNDDQNANDAEAVRLRNRLSPHDSHELRERRSGFVMKADRNTLSKTVLQKNLLDSMKSATLGHKNISKKDDGDALKTVPLEKKSVTLQNLTHDLDREDSSLTVCPDYFSLDKGDRITDCSYASIPDDVVVDSITTTETSFTMSKNTSSTSKRLALKDLTQAIDNLKLMIQDHFIEVINSLQVELDDLGDDTVIVDVYIDRNELVWKAYERYFSEKVLSSLRVLYETSLLHSITATYDNVSQTTKEELLEGDKILSLFYNGESEATGETSMYPYLKRRSEDNKDTYSMARTVSDFSLNILDCTINDLYALTNADSNDVVKRFNLNSEPEEPVLISSTTSSSSDSGASVKTTDLFGSRDNLLDTATATATTTTAENTLPKSGDTEHISRFEDSQIEDFSVSYDLENGKSTSDVDSKSTLSDPIPERRPLISRATSNRVSELLDRVLMPFMKQMEKCIKGKSILDKVRYLSKAIEGLNKDISKLYGADHQSVCDDIITMLILALSHMPKDVFVGLYINLNFLIDVLPKFLSGSLCEYNVVSLVASYDYLKNRNASQQIIRRDSADFGTN